MNERIKQLALRAFQPINDITSEGVADRRTFNQLWFEHYNQNFAELIVRECMQVVANQLPSNQYLDVAHAVIEHFGVEE